MSVENENQDFPWGHLTEESPHLGWSCLPLSCVVSAPFFQCFIFNSLALWVFLLTSGHKPFLKEAGSYKSPMRQSIKTSTIHNKTDLPPDIQDPAGSAVMPLGDVCKEGERQGGIALWKLGVRVGEGLGWTAGSQRLKEGMDFGLHPCTSLLASRESSVFPLHPAQIFPTTSVAFSYLSRICFRAKVSSVSLEKGQ